MKENKTIMLMILDGFGIREDSFYNGVLNSDMKNYFNLWNSFPHTRLHASGPLVGLPKGQIGSSEVGHMTIGAGRLIKEPIVQISEDIDSGVFLRNKKLLKDFEFVKKTRGNIHLMGLLGPGGVHSLDKHLYAFLDFYDEHMKGFYGEVFIHNFLDGRDTPQKSALEYLRNLDSKIQSLKNKDKFVISTICGRYYAMDRDKRWDRTKKAYDMLVHGEGAKFKSYSDVILSTYKSGITDEFILPSILRIKPILDGDLCVFYNFRSDRPKQIVKAFIEKDFKEFDVKKFENLKFLTLTDYNHEFKVDVLYGAHYPKNTLGEILSRNGLSQLRIAETEKFPHVTYFFSGLNEAVFEGEDRVKINSPKVATYDLKPQMSADEVTQRVIEAIKSNKYDFILLNFANPDMVGHTGNYDAVKVALRDIDDNILKIKEEVDKVDGTLLITSDHGNCDEMRDENGNPHTKHTYNLVPFILCDKNYELDKNYKFLSLFNIAPTILELFGIQKPKEMNVPSLIVKKR